MDFIDKKIRDSKEMTEGSQRLLLKYQKMVVNFANTWFGRQYLGVAHHPELKGKKIVKIDTNAVSTFTGKYKKNAMGVLMPEFHGIFRTYSLLAQKLCPALETIDIVREWYEKQNRVFAPHDYELLLNYTGIKTNRNFPTIMFDSDNFYVGYDGGLTYWMPSSWNWSTERNAASANSGGGSPPTSDDQVNCAVSRYSSGTQGGLGRGFFPVDTSAILPGGSASAIVAWQYYHSVSKSDFGGDICWIGTTQSGSVNLAQSDYSLLTLNTPTEFATRVDFDTITESAYNSFTFNAAGRTALDPNGVSKYGQRASKDVDNSAPASDGEDIGRIRYSGYTGTGSDPYYAITYTPGALTVTNEHFVKSNNKTTYYSGTNWDGSVAGSAGYNRGFNS